MDSIHNYSIAFTIFYGKNVEQSFKFLMSLGKIKTEVEALLFLEKNRIELQVLG
jgi:hypothetical protein